MISVDFDKAQAIMLLHDNHYEAVIKLLEAGDDSQVKELEQSLHVNVHIIFDAKPKDAKEIFDLLEEVGLSYAQIREILP